MTLLAKDQIQNMEYDLNVFYAERYSDAEGTTWDDVYTIQPSVYINTIDDRALRMYLEAFKLNLEETRAIAPDFPEEQYGSDFFIALETFMDQTRALPLSLANKLASLPMLDSLELDLDAKEINWIN
jgi:hypothetical protein